MLPIVRAAIEKHSKTTYTYSGDSGRFPRRPNAYADSWRIHAMCLRKEEKDKSMSNRKSSICKHVEERNQTLVVSACNLSYSGDGDQEDHSSRLAWAKR
jgi:glutamate racemase